jgi:16S rRNA (cytidine1402-2'-O)-methyltransferase
MTSDASHHTRLPPALYVVATPIGNLGDITLRALDTLRGVDRVAAEDTRVSGQLLAHFNIKKPLVSIREHNELEAAQKVIARIVAGEAIAYLADAGTPAISDPGARLVAAVRAAGLPVVPIPGASAVTTALSAAGLGMGSWLFYGFLPPKSGARQQALRTLAGMDAALVFYEAPHRVIETVADLASVLDPARTITIARELTKRFETILTLPLADARAWLEADPNHVRGEFVLIVHPPAAPEAADDAEARRILAVLLQELPAPQASRLTAQLTGRSKADLYKMALALKPPQTEKPDDA